MDEIVVNKLIYVRLIMVEDPLQAGPLFSQDGDSLRVDVR